jgi:hypothetical protein
VLQCPDDLVKVNFTGGEKHTIFWVLSSDADCFKKQLLNELSTAYGRSIAASSSFVVFPASNR